MNRIKILILSSLVVAILALGAAGYFYYKFKKVNENSGTISKEELNSLVDKVSKLIVLPSGEIPTIATVSDPNALKDQVFFAQAQKGDKVLIYAGAKKAILYSVSMNKILEVAPLNLGEKAVKNTPAPTPEVKETKTPTKTKK